VPSRRDLLATLAAVGLAGCTGDPGTGETPSRTPGRTPAETPRTDPPTATDAPTGSPGTSPSDTPTEPTGPAVRWTRDLGGSVRHRPTVHGGTLYVAGGTNANAPPEDREYLRPEAGENVYAFDLSGVERWHYEARAGVGGRPRVVGGGVHAVVGWNAGIHGADQRLVRLVDGERRWSTELAGGFLSILGSHDATTFVGTGDDALGVSGESIHAVDPEGSERWRIESGDAYGGTVHEGTLYVPYGYRRPTALDVETGTEQWATVMEPLGGDLRVFGDTLYLSDPEQDTEGDYPLVAVDAATGEERWRYASAGGDEGPFVPTGAVEGTDGRVFGTEYGGLLFALDAATGEELWRYSVDADTRESPLLADGTVYLAALDGRVHAVDQDGEPRWTRPVGARVLALRANEAGIVAATRGPGRGSWGLTALTHEGAERWSFTHPGRLTRAAVAGAEAYVGTGDGFVVALG
jgi:outer membrane protein assembly factor BamB